LHNITMLPIFRVSQIWNPHGCSQEPQGTEKNSGQPGLKHPPAPPSPSLTNKKLPFDTLVYKYSVWLFILSLPLPVTDFADICSMTVKKVSHRGNRNCLKGNHNRLKDGEQGFHGCSLILHWLL